MQITPSVDRAIYRAGLLACPPAFRREFATELLRDFDEARRDATTSRRDLWAWRFAVALDLVRTVVVEWLRSGMPLLALISVTLPLALAAGLASLVQRGRFWLPTSTPDAETIGLVLLATVVLIVIASTILFTTWFSLSVRRRAGTRCYRRER